MIISANKDINYSILMYVIIFFSVYLSSYENEVIIYECTNLGIIKIN